jgi:hypothetical protein
MHKIVKKEDRKKELVINLLALPGRAASYSSLARILLLKTGPLQAHLIG